MGPWFTPSDIVVVYRYTTQIWLCTGALRRCGYVPVHYADVVVYTRSDGGGAEVMFVKANVNSLLLTFLKDARRLSKLTRMEMDRWTKE